MQEENYPIRLWAKDDRPREKLLSKSPIALSDSELIAILIGHGNKQKSAVDLAKEILHLGKNNLHELAKLSVKELMKIKGIGEVKAITVAAALELGRRRQTAGLYAKTCITNSTDVAGYLQGHLKDLRKEFDIKSFLKQVTTIELHLIYLSYKFHKELRFTESEKSIITSVVPSNKRAHLNE